MKEKMRAGETFIVAHAMNNQLGCLDLGDSYYPFAQQNTLGAEAFAGRKFREKKKSLN